MSHPRYTTISKVLVWEEEVGRTGERNRRGERTPRQERRIAIAANSEYHRRESEISTVGLPPSFVGEVGAVETLGFEGVVEEEIDYAHRYVVDDLGCFGEVCEPNVGSVGGEREREGMEKVTR